ncbi:hypothetical protein BpHYR1_046343 [Brachionus plicatilis]|uniref:Uncharacterized protein n=1 Tax=Brachionus plicatilis TaxID=10195 RepID=A0A3M7PHP2_BRAPC|nr:hypothetical protein BpHYR1_046343 [Brachionus plicatilis]
MEKNQRFVSKAHSMIDEVLFWIILSPVLTHYQKPTFEKNIVNSKLGTVSSRLFELSESYVNVGLSHSVPLEVKLVEEYRDGFESIYIENPTPLLLLRYFYLITTYRSSTEL